MQASNTTFFSLQAEDKTKTVIVRLHEAFGGNCDAVLCSSLPFASVVACNGLEEPLDGGITPVLSKENPGIKICLSLSAFQIASLRCSLA